MQADLQSPLFVPQALPRFFAQRANIRCPSILLSVLHTTGSITGPTFELCSTTITAAQSDQHLASLLTNSCRSARCCSDIVSSSKTGNMSERRR